MRLPLYFIDRPIMAAVLSLITLLIGAMAMLTLPISEYPDVVPPSIVIRATYPGASPETIATTVAAPLEQQMTGIENMLYMFSQSTSDGAMGLTLTFQIGTDLQAALVEVQNRIQQATPRLPEEARRLGVVAQRASPDLLMVVHLISPDNTYDRLSLANFARIQVKDRLTSIPGIADVQVFGAGEYSMRIWLDPERMAARGLTPSDVVQAIREQNLQIAAGTIGQQPVDRPTGFEYVVTTQGRLVEQEQFEAIIVRRGEAGQLVRLRDVARIELGGNSYALRSLLNNQVATALPISQQPGSNALATSTAVRALMTELQKSFPAGIRHEIVYDPTLFVRASIKAVVITLIEAVVLVVIVVILFLQTWRASLIPLIAVPISLIGTFAVMQWLGFSINSLSLFGLVLAIGIVVDDAIVVVENVQRNISLGLKPHAATRQAMKEVSGPIVATALVLASVFIPTAFISGLTGRFYQQFALTIAISTVISAFNSLTLSPALAALLLKEQRPGHRPGGPLLGWFFALFNRFFAASSAAYVRAVTGILRFSVVALLLYAGLLAATWFGFDRTQMGFVPAQDKGYLVAFAKLPDGASLDRTAKVLHQMSELALKHPAINGAVAFPGLSINNFTNSSNAGIVFTRLKPFAQRNGPELTGPAVADALNQQFSTINDAFVLALSPPPIFGLGTTGGFKLYLEDRSNIGLEKLFTLSQAVLEEARQRPELTQVYSLYTLGVPKIQIDIDREKVATQGLRLAEVHDALQGYFGTLYANDFNRFGRTYQVNVQADAPFRLSIEDLGRIKVRNGNGVLVPLSGYITVRETAGPERAMQFNGFPAIDINGAAKPGYSSDQAQTAIKEVLAKVLPPGVSYEWTEMAYQQITAGNSASYIFPLCVLLVLLVLAAFYESLTLPLAIVLIVPMCLLSALVGIYFSNGDNNIMTQIGLIVLMGLACKNAILIVEFAKETEVLHGASPLAAALEACRLRLRPILMTSLAFIMGVWPLVDAHGAGAELRQATGLTVFAGMIGVTIFGLLLTPVFYVTLRRLTGGKLKSHSHEPPSAPG